MVSISSGMVAMIREPESWNLCDLTSLERKIKRLVRDENWLQGEEFIFITNDEGDGCRDILLIKRSSIVDGSWTGMFKSEFNLWRESRYENDVRYHLYMEKGTTTRARFFDHLADLYPKYLEWFLFHPEWL